MSNSPRVPRSRTRKAKSDIGEEIIVKEKFIEDRKIPALQAKTGNQKLAISFMKEGRQLVVLTGAAGVGKSLLAAHRAAELYRSKQAEKIILIRPLVSVGHQIGALPGSVLEKLSPPLAPIIAHLEKFLYPQGVKYALEKEQLVMMPLEFIRGSSFEHCVVIAEECQNCSPSEMMALVTRIGEGSCLYITGDKKQNDLRGKITGIEYLEQLIYKYSNDNSLGEDVQKEFVNNSAVVSFTNDDVVRSGITKAFVKAFNKEGV